MDGLIVVLLILGLVMRISKGNKRKRNGRQGGGKPSVAERLADALENVAELESEPLQRPRTTETAPKPAKEAAEKKGAVQLKIPYTQEEWSSLLSEKSAPQKPTAPKAKSVSKPALKPKPLPAEGRSLEGISFEGEAPQEHAAHTERITREEARIVEEREEQLRLREVNLQRLRSAVVMSEVLGKPIALRRRR